MILVIRFHLGIGCKQHIHVNHILVSRIQHNSNPQLPYVRIVFLHGPHPAHSADQRPAGGDKSADGQIVIDTTGVILWAGRPSGPPQFLLSAELAL